MIRSELSPNESKFEFNSIQVTKIRVKKINRKNFK